MALGGGSFVFKDKLLPGTYINVVSKSAAAVNSFVSGVAAMPLTLDWGVENEIFTVTNEDFLNDSQRIFGYHCTHEKMKGLRDLFKNAQTLHAYRLSAGALKAQNAYATAKFGGIKGNDIRIIVAANLDDSGRKDVSTYFDNELIDKQTVSTAAQLSDNDFVVFNKTSTLSLTVGTSLSGGANGSVDINEYTKFLKLIESYSFNILAADTVNSSINALIVSFTKRMRDENGIKFQALVYNTEANYEGVISFNNGVSDSLFSEAALAYWLAGGLASCNVNQSILNKKYDGEFEFSYQTSMGQLKKNVEDGFLTLHMLGDSFAVLADINTLTGISVEKGNDFKNNQTIRILDYLSNTVAALFNSVYLGVVPNNEAGRISLWSDIVSIHKDLSGLGVIEGFVSESVKVEKGLDKGSVVITSSIMPVNAMAKLYATIIIV